MRWFRSKHAKPSSGEATRQHSELETVTGAAHIGDEHNLNPREPLIRHVAGVKADIKITLPDGGKSRLQHYARLGSPSLGRVRIDTRNLALRHEPGENDKLRAVGEIAANEVFPAFTDQAEEGMETDWHIPLAEGEATVKILVTREDVPA